MKAVGRVIPRTMGAEIGLPQFVENRTKRTELRVQYIYFVFWIETAWTVP
jgi:hypothetical protein